MRLSDAWGLGLAGVVAVTCRALGQAPVTPPDNIKVIGSFRATDRDGTMRVRCTVTEERKVKDCENLSLDPQLAALTHGGRSPDLDARVERWVPMAGRRPGVQEFKIRFSSPADAGTSSAPSGR